MACLVSQCHQVASHLILPVCLVGDGAAMTAVPAGLFAAVAACLVDAAHTAQGLMIAVDLVMATAVVREAHDGAMAVLLEVVLERRSKVEV